MLYDILTNNNRIIDEKQGTSLIFIILQYFNHVVITNPILTFELKIKINFEINLAVFNKVFNNTLQFSKLQFYIFKKKVFIICR